MKRFIWIVIAAVVVFGFWAIGMPYIAATQLQRAAKQGDAIGMNQVVDFPALRESVRNTFKAEMTKQAASSGDGMEALGTMLAGAFVDQMIDSMITPEGISALMEEGAGGLTGNAGTHVNITMGPQGFGRFDIKLRDPKTDDVVSLVFLPKGFFWKLSAITLPQRAFQ
jgi:hypothetical protein